MDISTTTAAKSSHFTTPAAIRATTLSQSIHYTLFNKVYVILLGTEEKIIIPKYLRKLT